MDLKDMKPEEIDVHKKCGSADLEERHWVNINTDEVGSNDGTDDIYCNYCEEIFHCSDIISMADYDDNKFDMSELRDEK